MYLYHYVSALVETAHYCAILLYVRAHLELGNFPPLLCDLLALCVNWTISYEWVFKTMISCGSLNALQDVRFFMHLCKHWFFPSEGELLHCKQALGFESEHIRRTFVVSSGVESFDVDIKEQKVTVKGNVTPDAVLQTVSKTGKKTAFWEAEPSAASAVSS